MVELSFGRAFRDFDRHVARDVRPQVPFATARALTRTAQGAGKVMARRIEVAVDRPTPFTLRAPVIIPARKTRLVAVLKPRDIQARYLETLETGGLRLPRSRALLVPVGARLNRYGNLPRRAVQRLLARPDVFSGTVAGVAGIWQRTRRRGIKLLLAYEDRARYEPRLGMAPVIVRYVNRTIGQEFEKSLLQAIASAR